MMESDAKLHVLYTGVTHEHTYISVGKKGEIHRLTESVNTD